MKNKFYSLILMIFCCGWWTARAQDTTSCNARFTAAISGNEVVFTAADSATGVQHFWNFGDTSHIGYGPYPRVSHTYSHPGTFQVTHLVRDSANGCHDSSTQLITIGGPPPGCSITFAYSHDSTRPGQPYYFIAQANLAGATHDTITWTINNTIAGTGDTLTRVLQPGTYTVCANLSTNLGCQSQYCETITAGDTTTTPPPPQCSVSVTVSHDSTQPDQPYLFFAFPSLAGAASGTVTWTVNDSTAGTGDTLTRVLQPGTYTVCASLVTNLGCQSQSCITIMSGDTTTAPPPPQCNISFTYSHDSTLSNQPYYFVANAGLAGAASDTITWTVNGTTAGTGGSLTRSFGPGVYTVCANLSTNLGCQSQYCQTIGFSDSTSPDTTGQSIPCFPNPAYSGTNLIIRLNTAEMISIRVYNSMGSQVETKTVAGMAGTNFVYVPLGSLQTGIYYIQLQYGNETRRSRVQKL